MELKDKIKQSVTIPDYFERIILPTIPEYYAGQYVDFVGNNKVCCPLHDEDTPSCHYYADTQTFHCFGCGAHGDVISLHQLFQQKMTDKKPTFAETLNFFNKFFLVGDVTVKVFKDNVIQKEYLSTKQDAMEFSRYVEGLEKLLLSGSARDFELEKKKVIWKEMDMLRSMLRLNKVNAKEALVYMKEVVKRVVQGS